MSPGRIAIAATTFACMTLLSIGGPTSAQADDAQARAARPQASKHVAAGSHQQHRRVARRAGPNAVAAGAGLAAGAIGTADAMAAVATSPFGAGGPYAGPGGYFATSAWGDYECSPGYGDCRPYASKDWSTR